jgi:hypothetical protein
MKTTLFTSDSDRTQTQLAYKVRCYPWPEVPIAGKQLVSWRRHLVQTKSAVISCLDEDMTTYQYRGRVYSIVWTFNNIPTREEWERKTDNFLITVDLRFSPAIKEMAVAIFSFNQN